MPAKTDIAAGPAPAGKGAEKRVHAPPWFTISRVHLKPTHLVAAVILAVAAALVFLPVPGLDPAGSRAAALTLFAIGFWATGLLPEHITALIFFLAAVLLSVASTAVIFSGFASTAIWLVFSGLVIGIAIKHTGLGARLAHTLVRRISHSYLTAIAGLVLVAVLLAFIMPSSMGRAVLLIPIVASLAEALGYGEHSRGRTGMVIAAGMACFVPGAAILPAAVPNMVLIGTAETLYGVDISYANYLLLHFPVSGLLYCALIVVLTTVIYREPPRQRRPSAVAAAMTTAERRLAILLVSVLLLWGTDFLHGISPAWIGLAAAIICLLPRFGVLPPQAFSNVNMGPVFYVAGILGMAAVVVDSGLGQAVGAYLLRLAPIEAGAAAWNFGVLIGLAGITGIVATMAGLPALLTPLAGELSAATAMPLETVLMSQVIGYTTLIFPYQSPPLVVALQLGGVPVTKALKLTLLYALIGFTVVIPINYFWWRWLGMFSA